MNLLTSCCKCIPQRRLVTVLLLVASFFFFLFRITMFLFLPYGSDLNDSHEVLLSPFEEGLLIASFFWGYCIGHIPFHYMVTSFNGKSFLLISMLVACLTTLFIPYVFMKDQIGLALLLRFLLGLFTTNLFTITAAMVSTWAIKDSIRFELYTVTLGSFLAVVIGPLIFAYLIIPHHYWQGTFTIPAILGLLWVFLWGIFIYTRPEWHPCIGRCDLQDEITCNPIVFETQSLCFAEFFKSRSGWGIIIAEFGQGAMMFLVQAYLPKYLKQVLGFEDKATCVTYSILYLIYWIFSVIFMVIVNHIIAKDRMHRKELRIIMTSISVVPAIMCLICIAFCGDQSEIVLILFGLMMMFKSACYAGVRSNITDIAPNASIIMNAVVGTFNALSFTFLPIFISSLVGDSPESIDWLIPFIMVAGIALISYFLFVFLMSDCEQEWADPCCVTE